MICRSIPSRYRVRVGDYYNKDDPAGLFSQYENSETFGVTKLIRHEDYVDYPAPVNDITIVVLEKKANGHCATFG